MRTTLTTIALVIVLIFISGAALLGWLGGSVSGLRWIVHQVVRLSDGALAVEGVQGALSGPLHIARLSYENAELHATIQDLRLDWPPRGLWQGRVTVDYVRIGDLHLTLKGREDKQEAEPLALPKALGLPVELAVQDLSIAKLTITQGVSDYSLAGLHARLSSTGAVNVLELSAARTPIGAFQADLRLGAAPPFPLNGTLNLSRSEAIPAYRVKGLLAGDLAHIVVTATAEAQAASGKVSALVTAFDRMSLVQLQMQANGLDPGRLSAGAPRADIALNLEAQADPAGQVKGKINLVNALPGTWDQKGLPLKSVFVQISGNSDVLRLTEVQIDLDRAGRFSGQGRIEPGKAELSLATGNFNLQGILGGLKPTELGGEIRLNSLGKAQSVQVDLRQDQYRIEGSAEYFNDTLTLRFGRLRAASGTLALKGRLSLSKEQSVTATGALQRFNPAALGDYPRGAISSEFSFEGQLAPEPHGGFRFSIDDSELQRKPFTGRGEIEVDAKWRIRSDVVLALAENRLEAKGEFGAPEARLRWRIDAPRLARIGPDFGGVLRASGTLRGSFAQPALDFTLDATRLRLPGDYAVARMNGEGRIETPPEGALEVGFKLVGLRARGHLVDRATLNVSGTLSRHVFDLSVGDPKLDLEAGLAGGWRQDRGWRGLIRRFQNKGLYEITLLSPARLAIGRDRMSLGKAAFELADGTLTFEQIEKEGARLTTRGELRGLALAKLLQWAPRPTPLETTLKLGGEWSLAAGDRVNGHVVLRREKGDVTLPATANIAMGLSRLNIDTRIEDDQAKLSVVLAGSRLGRVSLEGGTALSRKNGNWGLDGHTPLYLNSEADVSSLSWLGLLDEGNLETGGRLTMQLSGTGTLADPRLKGFVRADDLLVKLIEEGVALRDGRLEADFSNNRLVLKELVFHGEEGDIKVNGTATLIDQAPRMGLDLHLAKLKVLSLPDRELVASGAGTISLRDQRLRLEGKLKADRALIELPDLQVPTLSQDVVIIGAKEKTEKQSTPLATDLDIVFDLGNKFYVKAKGLDARLSGSLTVHGVEQGPPRGYGNIRVAEGNYFAYGQRLILQRGSVSFNGPMDNPVLNILAVRKDPVVASGAPYGEHVEAGVKITGTALAPRVTLVSTPEVPDGEKLAWLVLGHGLSDTSRSEFDLLGTAASALLARGESVTLQARIAQALGLSEFGFSGGGQLQSTVVTLGKKLSARTYLTFEQSLRGVSRSLAKLRYEFNPRWLVQAATGTENALDLFYTIRFD